MANKKMQIILKETGTAPTYATPAAAGADLYADIPSDIVIPPGWRAKVELGFCGAIPDGYFGFITPRSGLAERHGISILNAPGTIDSDYRGTWAAILVNHDKATYTVSPGDRIAQVVFIKGQQFDFEPVESLPETKRGKKGFGSSGK